MHTVKYPGLMGVKKLVFKTWSSLVSTVWVGLYVKSDAQSDALQMDTQDADLITGSAGTLQDAAQLAGRPVVPVSAPAKPEMHIRKGFLWQAAFWIGILMLITGCLTAGIVLYSLVSSPACGRLARHNWLYWCSYHPGRIACVSSHVPAQTVRLDSLNAPA